MPPIPSPPEQQLLDLLHQHPSLGNAKARELLQWSESQYEVVKANLVLQGIITQGRGRGGSIKLAVNTSPEAADHLAAEPMDLQPMGAMGTRPPKTKDQEADGSATSEPKGLRPKDSNGQ